MIKSLIKLLNKLQKVLNPYKFSIDAYKTKAKKFPQNLIKSWDELNINSHSRKIWNTSLERETSYLWILFLEKIMMLMLFHSKILDSNFLRLAQRR
jgi:hypothetical protein